MNNSQDSSLPEVTGKQYSPKQTQEVKAAAIRQAVEGQKSLMVRSDIRTDISDVQAVAEVAERYINDCAMAGLLPNTEGLCCALGLSRAWFYQFLREKASSPSALYLNKLRMAWVSLRISLAERQVLDPAMCIFVLKNSHMGFVNEPDGNDEMPMQTDPNRPEWAYGMSEAEYAAASRKRIADIIAALPEPDGLDDIPPASYGLAEKYLLHNDNAGQD